MKTNFVRQCGFGLAAGLIFFLGCARPSAEPPGPKAVVAPGSLLTSTSQSEALAPVNTNTPLFGAADTNAPAILGRIPPSSQTSTIVLSPGLAEVVKLAQAGVSEEVIMAYVERYDGRFEVGADQILYLNDLGLSSTIIATLLKHDDSAVAQVPPTNVAPALGQKQTVSNLPVTPAPQKPVAEGPALVQTSVAPPPTSTEVSYFYDTLSPYGSWVYLSTYGWCWQPTVAVSVPTWRPYCDRGRWYWSDDGWYWNSDYSWGWAAFHYGRWYQHASSGWVWAPGTTWAPSWVSWRYQDGYCGWAPLPPEAHFVSGVGFSYRGGHVGIGFEFGLRSHHYAFVPTANFCDYSPYRYVVPHGQVQNFYRNTTVINNYTVVNRNHVINHGVGRETVARVGQNQIRQVSLRETPVRNMASVRGDRLEKEGNQLVVYRPQLPRTPPVVNTARYTARPAANGQNPATVSRSSGVGAASPANTSTGRQTPMMTRGRADTATTTGPATVPARAVPQERQGRTPANTGPTDEPRTTGRAARSSPQSQPEANASQPRSSGAVAPLFGRTEAVPNATPRNNPAVNRTAEPSARSATPVPSQPQVQRNYAPQSPTRIYSQPQTRSQASSPAVQAEPRQNSSRSIQSSPNVAPRQYDQTPHQAAPQRNAPERSAPQQEIRQQPAPQRSEPAAVRSAPERTRQEQPGSQPQSVPGRSSR